MRLRYAGVGTLFINLMYACALIGQNRNATEITRWQAIIPEIQAALEQHPSSCQSGTVRATPLGAADFAGKSFALIDVCPLGAYTELIDVMQLDGNRPVFAHFRKEGHKLRLGFSRGASAMHGKDVQLVPDKHAIYNVSWDNDGLDQSGIIGLQKCVVDAYVWNTKYQVFDYDAKVTKGATQNYCRDLLHRAH